MVTDFKKLIDQCDNELNIRGYSTIHHQKIRTEWDRLKRWMEENSYTDFTESIGLTYCDENFGAHILTVQLNEEEKRGLRAIRMLISFQKSGEFEFRTPRVERVFIGDIGRTIHAYLQYGRYVLSLSNETIRNKELYLYEFHEYLNNNSFTLNDLSSDIMEDFFSVIGYSLSSRHVSASTLRIFLRYVYEKGLTPKDYSIYILPDNYKKHNKIPTTYNEAEIRSIISSVERSSAIGKRDYLILLFEEETQNQFLSESLRASSLFPDNGLFHYFAGYGFLFQEKRKEALVSFETALPFLSDNASLQAQVYGLMGDLYFLEQQAQKAFRAYEESLKLEQENVVVLNNYAYYLSELDLHLDKAERMISRVIELEGSNPTYLDTYAWVLFKRGQYLDALYFIEQAVANMEEESAVLYEHYGDILFKVGNIEKALEKWNKALELGSDVSSVLEDKIAEQKYLPEIKDYE